MQLSLSRIALGKRRRWAEFHDIESLGVSFLDAFVIFNR